jgi:hypothetical protein
MAVSNPKGNQPDEVPRAVKHVASIIRVENYDKRESRGGIYPDYIEAMERSRDSSVGIVTD